MINEFKLKKLFMWETLHDKIKTVESDSVKTVKLTLTPAQIKTLNTSPVQLLPAPGAGKRIVIISAQADLIFATTAYNFPSGNSLVIGSNGVPSFQAIIQNYLNSSNNYFAKMFQQGGNSMAHNAALFVSCLEGDATVGDSPITVYAQYMITDL